MVDGFPVGRKIYIFYKLPRPIVGHEANELPQSSMMIKNE